jgi:putative membrane protein
VAASGVYGPNNDGHFPDAARRTRFWIILVLGIAIVATIFLLFLVFYPATLGAGSSGPRPYIGYWGGFFLVFLLVWVSFFIVRVAFWTSRSQAGYYRRRGRFHDPAVMTARQRYARGEITREQYDQIMTDLDRRGRGPGGPLSGA